MQMTHKQEPAQVPAHLRYPMHALRAARLEAGYTQAELAELCGVDQSAVSRLEAGEPGGWETLNALAAAMGVPVHQIIAAEQEVVLRLKRANLDPAKPYLAVEAAA